MKYNIKFEGIVDLEPVDQPAVTDLIERHLAYDPLVYYPANELAGRTVRNHGLLEKADIIHNGDDIAGVYRGPDDQPAPGYSPAGSDGTLLYTPALAANASLSNRTVSCHFRYDGDFGPGERVIVFRYYANSGNELSLEFRGGSLFADWNLGGAGHHVAIPAIDLGIVPGEWNSAAFVFDSKKSLGTVAVNGSPVASGPCGTWNGTSLNSNATMIAGTNWGSPEICFPGSVAHWALFQGVFGPRSLRAIAGK